jgi:GT2 family glycosyltransferase
VEKDFFKNSLTLIKKEKPDILVPLTIEREGPRIDSFGIEYFRSGYAKNAPTFDIETQLGAMACLLIGHKLMSKMKSKYGFCLNETLFSYLDDVEFSIRARGLGAKFIKGRDVKVHHMVSYTAGKKSYFVMFHTYRNILWLIIMTWPLPNILRHLYNILLVQGWIFLYGLKSYGPALQIKIVWETLLNLKTLLVRRRKILSGYMKGFDFETILSKYSFRTYHGITIK